jgi:hypothetical protein
MTKPDKTSLEHNQNSDSTMSISPSCVPEKNFEELLAGKDRNTIYNKVRWRGYPSLCMKSRTFHKINYFIHFGWQEGHGEGYDSLVIDDHCRLCDYDNPLRQQQAETGQL